jgi:hypothetical protein
MMAIVHLTTDKDSDTPTTLLDQSKLIFISMYFLLPITGEQNFIILSIFSNPNIFGEMQNFIS